jgi:hypothetical protein
MNGNDLLEHIESCESCQELQDKIDTGKLSEDEVILLTNQQIECFNDKLLGIAEMIKDEM